jgi:L-lactate dehydrogenase complex protein LldG
VVEGAPLSSAARAEILRRVRGALRDVPRDERPEEVPVAQDYERAGRLCRSEVLGLFEDRVRDYGAVVRRVEVTRLADGVLSACRELGLGRVAVPPALPTDWRPPDVELVQDHGLSARELDAIDGALTGCAVAIAQTGTLVLDGQGASGRRLLTLVPDNHICVVEAEQVVESVPEGFERVADAVRREGRPITLVSGPSASSDIELTRVEGVHGPRHLFVLVVVRPD